MFGYNTLGFGSIAGTAGPPDLDFTLQGGAVSRGNATYTGVSIGTANTTADIVIGGGGGTFTQQIITLNTVNTAPNQNSITTTSVPQQTTRTSTMTTDPVSDDGVFIWGLAHIGGGPQYPTSSLLTSHSNGVTLTINQPVNSDYTSTLMGYSVCTTTDSRNAQTSLTNGVKITIQFYSVFAYFEAN